MKILTNYGKQGNLNKPVFKGTPLRLPTVNVRNYHDALEVWNKLKFAKYLKNDDDIANRYEALLNSLK